ncbi:Fe(3+)-hydroxamate ABC transporter permease FhuB [Musicola keenii]|uniref:Fe(3+)-hydroxamate ABC transporter permease FhuB n=1 Tax=Musicola keenii TaxID=2884250 RepID=UPI00177FD572
MANTVNTVSPAKSSPLLVTVLLGLLLPSIVLCGYNLGRQLSFSLWFEGLFAPADDDIRQVLFHYSLLPRLALSLLVGAGLGLVGVLFQQVLRNPLAEPSTLGVATGAQLGLTVATLWALPGGELTSQLAAMTGALLVGGLVFGVAWGRRLSPVTLILAGLVLSLYCSAVSQLLALFHYEQLTNLFLWSSGALNQQDWQVVNRVWPMLLGGLLIASLLARPLTLLGLDDDVARNLGLALALMRAGTLLLAIFLSAQWVNAAGIIGFIGLFAPLMAKMLGARRLGQRLWLAPLLGALLLCLTDQLLQWLATVWLDVPTGAATALLGAPLLLWLLPRLRTSVPSAVAEGPAVLRERAHWGWWWLAGLGVTGLAVVAALCLGRDAGGWYWAMGDALSSLLPWRWPRLLAALSAGVMLAVAGALIQRLTGNPMGSPEVLGVSAGAALGVVVLLFLMRGDALTWMLPAGSAGALGTLLIIMLTAGRGGVFSSQRMLLVGIAIGTAFTTLISLVLASGDPRSGLLLTWLSGSTYRVTPVQALVSALTASLLVVVVPLCQRWLQLLPLGTMTVRSLGMAATPVRLAILALASVLTAVATMVVGPMSFVGLMAPHLARMMGFNRVIPQMAFAALLGGGLMVLADWCGRTLLFPYQIPAGLLATFIGAPYFIWLLRRQAR